MNRLALNDQPGGYIKYNPEGRSNCKWSVGDFEDCPCESR